MKEEAREEIPFEDIFRGMSEAALIIDDDGSIRYTNESAGELLYKGSDELLGSSIGEVFTDLGIEELKNCMGGDEEGLMICEDVIKYEENETPVEARFENVETEKGWMTLILLKDITERRKEREKEDFLHSLLRHDLRNKIQVNRGYLQLLLDTDLSEKQKEFAEKALDTIKEGNELIEKVRRIRGISEQITAVSIKKEIQEAIDQNENELDDEGISVEIDGEDCMVMGGELLVELFSNLLSNSINHASCETIRFEIEEDEEECVIKVKDDGNGVSEEAIERIFERGFATGENAGSGLGLYFVQIIAESYGGRVGAAESDMGGLSVKVVLQRA